MFHWRLHAFGCTPQCYITNPFLETIVHMLPISTNNSSAPDLALETVTSTVRQRGNVATALSTARFMAGVRRALISFNSLGVLVRLIGFAVRLYLLVMIFPHLLKSGSVEIQDEQRQYQAGEQNRFFGADRTEGGEMDRLSGRKRMARKLPRE
jgi:hypothetical protein